MDEHVYKTPNSLDVIVLLAVVFHESEKKDLNIKGLSGFGHRSNNCIRQCLNRLSNQKLIKIETSRRDRRSKVILPTTELRKRFDHFLMLVNKENLL
jgi:hypothetical protein